MDIPSGEWFFSLSDIVITSIHKINAHINCREVLCNQKFLTIEENWPENIEAKIVAVYVDFLNIFIHKFDKFKGVKIVLSHNGDFIPDEKVVVKWLNENPDIIFYAQNLSFEHPRAFILPIGQANSMWPHGNKTVWKQVEFVNKTIDVLKTHCSNTHNTRLNLNELNQSKIETIRQLNYKDFVNKLLLSKFVICPPGNGPDTHRLWETLSARAIPILLNTPFNNLLKKQYPDLPIIVVDDYFMFDYNSLEYNFPNYINLLDKNYWITKIRDEA